jgi:type II secretory pathway component PulL
MANLPEQVTRQMLLELVEAGLVYIDEDSDPNGYLLYGTWPTDEDISENWSGQRVTIIPATAFRQRLPNIEENH